MTTRVETNTTLTITVVFRDYVADPINGEPVDPDEVTVEVLDSESAVLTTDTPLNPSVGHYSYEWTSTDEGEYTVRFTGTFYESGSTTTVDYEEVIEETIIVDAAVVGGSELGETYESVFFTDVSPLYIDPDFIKQAFPTVPLSEITEYIYKYSVEVQEIFKSSEIPRVAYEYIEAATMCALASSHDAMGLLGGEGGSITLGDLSIDDSGSTSRVRGALTRGNAKNVCELSYALRTEMIRSAQGSKAVVKGFRATPKLPNRHNKLANKRSF